MTSLESARKAPQYRRLEGADSRATSLSSRCETPPTSGHEPASSWGHTGWNSDFVSRTVPIGQGRPEPWRLHGVARASRAAPQPEAIEAPRDQSVRGRSVEVAHTHRRRGPCCSHAAVLARKSLRICEGWRTYVQEFLGPEGPCLARCAECPAIASPCR